MFVVRGREGKGKGKRRIDEGKEGRGVRGRGKGGG